MTAKYCFECGAKSPSVAAKFCPSCGVSLDGLTKTHASTPSRIGKTVASLNTDEDDEEGSDVFEVPNISKLKFSLGSDNGLGIGGSSFTMGADGLTPTSFVRQ